MKIPRLTEHRPGPGSLVSAQRRLPSEKGGGATCNHGMRGGGHQTLHFIFGPTQAIPLEKPGLKNGKGYMVEYLFSARV